MDPTTLINTLAAQGAPAGTLSSQLMAAGYTVAQIQQLFNQVAASSVATPQIITYLQSENARLQQQQSNQNYFWAVALLLGGWLLISSRRSSR